jgi:hypothetical protein
MLEETYQELLYLGYSVEFLDKISSNREMHQNIMHIDINTTDTIIKCIAITDQGNYYRIVEHIRDKNKSYEPTINVVSKSIIDLLI